MEEFLAGDGSLLLHGCAKVTGQFWVYMFFSASCAMNTHILLL